MSLVDYPEWLGHHFRFQCCEQIWQRHMKLQQSEKMFLWLGWNEPSALQMRDGLANILQFWWCLEPSAVHNSAYLGLLLSELLDERQVFVVLCSLFTQLSHHLRCLGYTGLDSFVSAQMGLHQLWSTRGCNWRETATVWYGEVRRKHSDTMCFGHDCHTHRFIELLACLCGIHFAWEGDCGHGGVQGVDDAVIYGAHHLQYLLRKAQWGKVTASSFG